jgi:DNA-binding NtrC family response regulator
MSQQAEWLQKDLLPRPGKHGADLLNKPAILIAERDETERRKLKEALLRREFTVIDSSDKADALRNVGQLPLELILIGSLENGTREGLALAQQIRAQDRSLPIVLIARESSEAVAIAALKAGVNEYFKQPYSLEDLVRSINRYLGDFLSTRIEQPVKDRSPKPIEGDRMIGESPAMRDIRATIGRIASTDSNVLITGDTGT